MNPLKTKESRLQFYNKINKVKIDDNEVMRKTDSAFDQLRQILNKISSNYHYHYGDIVSISTSVLLILSNLIHSDFINDDNRDMTTILKSNPTELKKFPSFKKVIECIQSKYTYKEDLNVFKRSIQQIHQIYYTLLDCGEELLPKLLNEYLSILNEIGIIRPDKYSVESVEYQNRLIKNAKLVVKHILVDISVHVQRNIVNRHIEEVGQTPERIRQTGFIDATVYEDEDDFPSFVENLSDLERYSDLDRYKRVHKSRDTFIPKKNTPKSQPDNIPYITKLNKIYNTYQPQQRPRVQKFDNLEKLLDE